MKTPVAITLIVMGAFLITAPLVSDHLQRAQMASVLNKAGIGSVSLDPTLSGDYRLGCWLVGSLMVAAAVYYSRRGGSPFD